MSIQGTLRSIILNKTTLPYIEEKLKQDLEISFRRGNYDNYEKHLIDALIILISNSDTEDTLNSMLRKELAAELAAEPQAKAVGPPAGGKRSRRKRRKISKKKKIKTRISKKKKKIKTRIKKKKTKKRVETHKR